MTVLDSTAIPTAGRREIVPSNFAVSPTGGGGIAWSFAADGALAGAGLEAMLPAPTAPPGAGEPAGERAGFFSEIVSASHSDVRSAHAVPGEPSPREGRVAPVGPGEPDGDVLRDGTLVPAGAAANGTPEIVLEATDPDRAATASAPSRREQRPGADIDTGVGEDLELGWSDAVIEHRVEAVVAAGDRGAFLRDEVLHMALADLQERQPARWFQFRDQLKPLIPAKDLQSLLRPHASKLRSNRVRNEPPGPAPLAAEDPGRGIRYVEDGGWTAIEKQDPRTGTSGRIALAPFRARIEEKVIRDDGLGQVLGFRVVGTRSDGTPLPPLDLPATEFNAMEWPVVRLGLHLEAVRDAKNHLKAAILKESEGCRTRTVYRHTGWREIEGRWCYLHAGGAIGGDGADPQVQVELPDRLGHFALPAPPDGEALRAAVRAVCGLLELGSATRPGSEIVAAVALCLPFRAALGPTVFSVWFEGLSGAYKTELAANILQRFFGPDFHRENAPGGWFSTDNALEIQAYAAKDALFLIDDYRPPEGLDRARYENKAARLLRNAADRRGRDRARVDGTLQATKYPRGTLMMTAEAGPPDGDQAAIGRTLVVKIAVDRPESGLVGTLDPGVLRRCAAAAKAGLYARAMAGFLRWIAPRYAAIQADFRGRVDRRADALKAELGASGLHHRTPEIVADLEVGLAAFLGFARAVGAITPEDALRYEALVREGLLQAAHDQTEHHRESDPVEHFFDRLSAALVSGSACLADREGRPPAGREAACGWKREDASGPWRNNARWKAGWVDGEAVYLHPENAYAASSSLGVLAVSIKTLSRRLKDKGQLRQTDGPGGNTVKKTCEGTQYRVLVLDRMTVLPTAADAPTMGELSSPPVEEVL